jgi:hypothetical protein
MPSIPLKDAPAYFLKAGPKLRKAAGRALYSAALRGVSILQTQLIPAASPSPVDRRLYAAGWRAEPHMAGDGLDGADIYNVELHAVFIEKGVRAANVKPGKLMIQALAEWAKRKGLDGADTPQGARSVAFAIAQSMKRRGIWGEKGLHLLAKLMGHHMPKLVQEEFRREAAASPGG